LIIFHILIRSIFLFNLTYDSPDLDFSLIMYICYVDSKNSIIFYNSIFFYLLMRINDKTYHFEGHPNLESSMNTKSFYYFIIVILVFRTYISWTGKDRTRGICDKW